MAKRKRQLRLLGDDPRCAPQPETRPLFNSTEFPYDTPDEIAYNARRKKDGLFEFTPGEEEARKQALENGTAKKRDG
jgi:hypothetical protein